jgi:hypothetical protein
MQFKIFANLVLIAVPAVLGTASDSETGILNSVLTTLGYAHNSESKNQTEGLTELRGSTGRTGRSSSNSSKAWTPGPYIPGVLGSNFELGSPRSQTGFVYLSYGVAIFVGLIVLWLVGKWLVVTFTRAYGSENGQARQALQREGQALQREELSKEIKFMLVFIGIFFIALISIIPVMVISHSDSNSQSTSET